MPAGSRCSCDRSDRVTIHVPDTSSIAQYLEDHADSRELLEGLRQAIASTGQTTEEVSKSQIASDIDDEVRDWLRAAYATAS